MTRAILLTLAVSLPAQGAPAPFLPKKPQPQPHSLVGTSWYGDGVVADTLYRFRPGGQMVYTYRGRTFSNGKWWQEGGRVFWEMNSRYCWFEGQVQDGQLVGVAQNKPGGRWDLRMKRVEEGFQPLPSTDGREKR